MRQSVSYFGQSIDYYIIVTWFEPNGGAAKDVYNLCYKHPTSNVHIRKKKFTWHSVEITF